jgi:hypothetical protein
MYPDCTRSAAAINRSSSSSSAKFMDHLHALYALGRGPAPRVMRAPAVIQRCFPCRNSSSAVWNFSRAAKGGM